MGDIINTQSLEMAKIKIWNSFKSKYPFSLWNSIPQFPSTHDNHHKSVSYVWLNCDKILKHKKISNKNKSSVKLRYLGAYCNISIQKAQNSKLETHLEYGVRLYLKANKPTSKTSTDIPEELWRIWTCLNRDCI